MKRWRVLVWKIRVQLGLFLLLLLIHLLSFLGILPRQDTLFDLVSRFFEEYGLPAVAACSFVENIVGVNVYFPGSIVILLSMALTSGRPVVALATFCAIVLPTILSHAINYWIGRRVYRLDRRSRLGSDEADVDAPGFLEFFLAFWHPHTAAIACIRAGSTGLSVRGFAVRFLPASACWNSAWGLLMYNFGDFAKKTGGLVALFYIYVIGWVAWDVWKWKREGQ